ncbi:Fatty acid oxidation complex subunit alpha [Rubripirellula tenax]|uniref:Fatty acid oxidation complex subunit alpha n=1 Tax=Rubripirellula tenax TaxID=2528015 RepID=A0A5C6FEK3_9BACT|nr:3-hydroxyacyl-CoA dehydrogenase family protein [Rubripirellula tenax]TWU59192.1 Fatty acid oxidation complex subunit alpha [Rubripirellula tenax]
MIKGIVLVGAGTVGRAILAAHLDVGVSVHLVDRDANAIRSAADEVNHALHRSVPVRVSDGFSVGDSLSAVSLDCGKTMIETPTIVIESIAERLDVKRAFFADAEKLFGDGAILCSNTSTLRIGDIASSLLRPQRFAGMHFFMPVDQRPAVEIIRGAATDDRTISICAEHASRLKKEPLIAPDTPGFIVNRLLSPYLNQAMLLLCHGIAAERIERAALQYGMPMSPLELIDTIGTRTTFDAGRVYWQSFPQRIAPAPMLGKMIKRGRMGKASGGGFYDYVDGERSDAISPEIAVLADTYHRPIGEVSDIDLVQLLAIPMLIEAAVVHQEGRVTSLASFDTAMRGGLGFSPNRSWTKWFADRADGEIVQAIDRWKQDFKSMNGDSIRFDFLTA